MMTVIWHTVTVVFYVVFVGGIMKLISLLAVGVEVEDAALAPVETPSMGESP